MFVFVPRLVALRQQAPRRSKLLPATAAFALALTAAIRMIDRVARHAARDRTNAAMTRTAGFAKNHILVLDIADLPDGGRTILVDAANLTGGQTNLRVTFVPRHQRRRRARHANHLPAATG